MKSQNHFSTENFNTSYLSLNDMHGIISEILDIYMRTFQEKHS